MMMLGSRMIAFYCFCSENDIPFQKVPFCHRGSDEEFLNELLLRTFGVEYAVTRSQCNCNCNRRMFQNNILISIYLWVSTFGSTKTGP